MALDTYANSVSELEDENVTTLSPSATHQNVLNIRWDTPKEVLHLKENGKVFTVGETPKAFYVLQSGAIKLSVQRPILRGRTGSPEYIKKILGPGDLFGYAGVLKGAHEEQATALMPSEVYAYQPEVLRAFLNSPNSLGKRLLLQMMRDLEGKETTIQLHYLASVQERIAYQLVLLSDKFGVEKEDGLHLNLRLTRNELAQLAGTINESLSRHLTELKSEGVLELIGKEIVIKNREALMQRSGNYKSIPS